jgi:hypothetical protein
MEGYIANKYISCHILLGSFTITASEDCTNLAKFGIFNVKKLNKS